MTKLKTSHFERITSPLTGDDWEMDMVSDFGFEVPEDLPDGFKFQAFLTHEELVAAFKAVECLNDGDLTDPEERPDVALNWEPYDENAPDEDDDGDEDDREYCDDGDYMPEREMPFDN